MPFQINLRRHRNVTKRRYLPQLHHLKAWLEEESAMMPNKKHESHLLPTTISQKWKLGLRKIE